MLSALVPSTASNAYRGSRIAMWVLIPLIHLLTIVESAGRMALGFAKPFELAGTAPGGVAKPYVVVLAAVKRMLSLRQGRRA